MSSRIKLIIDSSKAIPTEIFNRKAFEWESQRAELIQQGREIKVQTPFGERTAAAYSVAPIDFIKDKEDKKDYLVASVDDKVWDLTRPLESSGTIRYHKWADGGRAQAVFWRSASTILGAATEKRMNLDQPEDRVMSSENTVGEDGFYNEFLLRNLDINRPDPSIVGTSQSILDLISGHPCYKLDSEQVKGIRETAKRLVDADVYFERLVVDIATAKQIFAQNPFQLYLVENFKRPEITLYRCGTHIIISPEAHVVSTGQVAAIDIVQQDATHFKPLLANHPNLPQTLRRVQGIAFPTTEALETWHARRKESARRDHRIVGKNQDLFMSHRVAPGSTFFLPYGTKLFIRLQEVLRSMYKRFGYEEIMTPLMYKKELWEKSGHWENYRDDMFLVGAEKDLGRMKEALDAEREGDSKAAQQANASVYGLKPMNCPGHCLVFARRYVSWRELPIRFADFSPLHRNEAHGALSGLTRLHRFHQDDAHIFCTLEQIQQEIQSTLHFFHVLYQQVLKFPRYRLVLATRPTSSMGEDAEWTQAEAALKAALNASGMDWTLAEGDGAFYGPKIDARIQDAAGKWHQTGTIQLDFQMPARFNLEYGDKQGKLSRPIMIHRAILGSFERTMAMMMEQTMGNWPFWLSPRQATVLPALSENIAMVEYADKVRAYIANGDETDAVFQHSWQRTFNVEVDKSNKHLSKRIRAAREARVNYILVAARDDVRDKTVDVRRNDEKLGKMTLPEVREMFIELDSKFE